MRSALRRHSIVLLLLAATAAAEEWKPLWEQWKAALKRYNAAVEQAPDKATKKRIKHPIGKFGPRLRRFAIDNAGYPRAAPALIELVRHSRAPEEQVWVMIQLRETHLRSKYLYRAAPALVRIGNAESLRTLREIAEGSPHERCAKEARLGVYELTTLAVGKPAPNPKGKAKTDGRIFSLRSRRGQRVVLALGETGRDAELRRLKGVTLLGIGNDLPGWADDLDFRRRFNAGERARIFVVDAKGVIEAKDPTRQELAALIAAAR
ncbi:MAG: hypothetical protein ACYTGN_12260 [Planctomycetota bacterium]|jgi:hypothetical protein